MQKLHKLLFFAFAGMLAAGAVSCSEDDGQSTAEVYSITVSNDGNGAATANTETAATGVEVTVTATPAEGFVFDKWTVESGDAELSDATAATTTFTMPAENVAVKANFIGVDVERYTITVSDDGNGTGVAQVDGQMVDKVEAGVEVAVTATPAEGFVFDKWTVESGDAELADATSATTTFTMPAEDVELKAEFKPEALPADNWIQIDGGAKQPILASVYALEEGEGTAFAFSPMNLTDRTAEVMESHLDFFVPQELMDKEVDVATDELQGDAWMLVVDLYKQFLERNRFENDYAATGTFKVAHGADADSFTIDMTDFTFSDGTKVSMHYEGTIAAKPYDDFLQYIAVLSTYDLIVGTETIKTQTVGYIQTEADEDDGVMCSNLWGYIDEPSVFYDLYFYDPAGGTFTDGIYNGTDYTFSELQFDGAFETDNVSDFFLEENAGKITFAKTATSLTVTFTDVLMSDEETLLNGTITNDVAAPLPTAPATRHAVPHKAHSFHRLHK